MRSPLFELIAAVNAMIAVVLFFTGGEWQYAAFLAICSQLFMIYKALIK